MNTVPAHTGDVAPLLHPRRPALVVALCNQKGGVGKTTSTINLARALAVAELRALVVDLDPQGNTTSTIAADDLPEDAVGVADVISPDDADCTMADVIVPSIWPGVDLAPTPSTDALTEAESRIETMRFGREKRLAQALAPLADDYDMVLIDNTPSLGLLLINALVAAHEALIVTQPEQWSADGLERLHHTINLVIEHHNTELTPIGPLINGKRKSAHHDRIVDEIVEFYSGQAWSAPDDIIPLRAKIADQMLAGKGLDEGGPDLRVIADTYRRFLHRMFQRKDRV